MSTVVVSFDDIGRGKTRICEEFVNEFQGVREAYEWENSF
jgi:hypothetical protein